MDVQEAGDAARIRDSAEGLAVESGIDAPTRAELRARGHQVIDGRGWMGGYQAVMVDPQTGVLQGGSDLRKDGQAAGI